MVGRSNEQAPAIDARPAWPPQRVTKDGHVRSGSFTGRYERARRALRAKRRAALLGFPLPAAQRVDARYEKTYRAAQRSHRAPRRIFRASAGWSILRPILGLALGAAGGRAPRRPQQSHPVATL